MMNIDSFENIVESESRAGSLNIRKVNPKNKANHKSIINHKFLKEYDENDQMIEVNENIA